MNYVKAFIRDEQYTSTQLKQIFNADKIISYGKDGDKSIYGVETEDIATFVTNQNSILEAEKVNFTDVEPFLKECFIMSEYDKIIERKIAEKYSYGKELKMRDLEVNNPDRIEYETFKDGIKDMVNIQKKEMGLIK